MSAHLPKFKKPENNKSIIVSKAYINEFNRKVKQAEIEIKSEMIELCSLLFVAYVMEEQPIDCDADKIIEIYKRLNWWAENVNDPTVNFKMKYVAQIIIDKTD